MVTYFITLKSDKGYKDETTSMRFEDEKISPEKVRTAGVIKICFKHQWDKRDLLKYGYTKVSIRKEGEAIPANKMLELAYESYILMKNGLPIATVTTKGEAELLKQQFKKDLAQEPGIYKIYKVPQYVSDTKFEKGNYRLKIKEEN